MKVVKRERERLNEELYSLVVKERVEIGVCMYIKLNRVKERGGRNKKEKSCLVGLVGIFWAVNVRK